MNYLINVSTNFKNGHWSSVSNHVNRNYGHSRNTGIDANLSQFNQNLTQAKSSTLIYHHFKNFVAKHDKHAREQGHPKREYHSVKDYIKESKGEPTSNVVIKFGTMQDKLKLEKKFGKNRIRKADNLGFKIYANQFNKRHIYLEMAEAKTNVDEKGANHLHYCLVRLGHTKSGKPSKSLNSALRCEYKTRNRILAMKKFHTDDDKFLISCMNIAYKKVISSDINFKLHRTNKAHHLSEKIYEKSATKKRKLDHASRHQNKRLIQIKPIIKKTKHQAKEPKPKAPSKIQEIINNIQQAIKIAENYTRKLVNKIEEKKKLQQEKRPSQRIK